MSESEQQVPTSITTTLSTAHPEGLEPVDTQVETDEVQLADGTRVVTKITTITFPDGNVCKRKTVEHVRMVKRSQYKKDGKREVTWGLRRRGVCCCCIPLHWFPCFRKKNDDEEDQNNDRQDPGANVEKKPKKEAT